MSLEPSKHDSNLPMAAKPVVKQGESSEPAEGSPGIETAADDGILVESPGNESFSSDRLPHDGGDATVISNRPPLPTPSGGVDFSPKEISQTLLGTTLGHYSLEEFIGSGGMGTVFKATDTMLDRTVAVKILSRNQSNAELIKRFRNEAQSAARLDHENIARVYYVGQDKGWNFIVFEYVEGENVRDIVNSSGPLSLSQALSYSFQVCEALDHAFRRNVIHRDIKPSNLVITSQGRVKIVDMGLARLHQVEASQDDLTASGVTLGTFDYISPEQAKDPRNADVRSDIYSLGCTLFYMFTGKPPFPDGTVLQKLLSHNSDKRPDARRERPELPRDVTRILQRMLEPDPSKRYQQPKELSADLFELAQRTGITIAPAGSVVIHQRQGMAHWFSYLAPISIPAALLVAALFGIDQLLPQADTEFRPQKPDYAESGRAADSPEGDEQFLNQVEPIISGEEIWSGVVLSSNEVSIPRADSAGTEALELEVSDVGVNGGAVESSVLGDQDLQNAAQGSAVGGELEPIPTSTESSVDRMVAGDEDSLPVDPLEVRKLLVGVTLDSSDFQSVVVATVDEAFAMASRFPNLESILLGFDGTQWVKEKIEISLPDLTIEPLPDFRPALIFAPEDVKSRRAVEIDSNHIRWSNIDFCLMLPQSGPPTEWSLFHVRPQNQFSADDLPLLEFNDCSFTVNNAISKSDAISGDGTEPVTSELHWPVSIVSFTPRPDSANRQFSLVSGMEGFSKIRLSNCVARGEMFLVYDANATPFELTWNQGLFVSSQRMIEIKGDPLDTEPNVLVRLSLTNVTSVTEKGLVHVVSRDWNGKSTQLDLVCIGTILRTPSDVALIAHSINQPLGGQKDRLRFSGRDNVVSMDTMFWQRDYAGMEGTELIGVTKLLTFDESDEFGEWFEHPMDSLYRVRWKWPIDLFDKPAHESITADFEYDELTDDGPGPQSAGFSTSRVPRFPLGLPKR